MSMVAQARVYIAGPEVFHPDAEAIGRRKKAICKQEGFIGLFPLDNEIDFNRPGIAAASRIYNGNKAMMDEADIVIANLTPFRGVAADPGTVFELGYAVGRGLLVFGYSLDPRTMLARTIASRPGVAFDDSRGRWLDADGLVIEDFGLGENLMIACALLGSDDGLLSPQAPTAADSPEAFDLFARCLRAARLRVDRTSRFETPVTGTA